MANRSLHTYRRSVLFLAVGLATLFRVASSVSTAADSPSTELERLEVQTQPWLTEQAVMPAGTFSETTIPDTLDLAEVAREAVHGLTAFLGAGKWGVVQFSWHTG